MFCTWYLFSFLSSFSFLRLFVQSTLLNLFSQQPISRHHRWYHISRPSVPKVTNTQKPWSTLLLTHCTNPSPLFPVCKVQDQQGIERKSLGHLCNPLAQARPCLWLPTFSLHRISDLSSQSQSSDSFPSAFHYGSTSMLS